MSLPFKSWQPSLENHFWEYTDRMGPVTEIVVSKNLCQLDTPHMPLTRTDLIALGRRALNQVHVVCIAIASQPAEPVLDGSSPPAINERRVSDLGFQCIYFCLIKSSFGTEIRWGRGKTNIRFRGMRQKKTSNFCARLGSLILHVIR